MYRRPALFAWIIYIVGIPMICWC